MPYFGLPDIPLKRLQAPKLGPHEFNGRKEHACDKWTRILTLLQYANSRVSKSNYNIMAGCIGSSLGGSEHRRRSLSDEAHRQLIDQAGAKWLGLEEDWVEPFFEMPAWMRPEGMDVDKTRTITAKDPNNAGRRPISFEAVWLEDFPGGSPDLGPKCKQFWADKELKDEFGIAERVKLPGFAFPGTRQAVCDPRDFSNYPQWRDSLRAQLSFTDWKMDFFAAYLIDGEITKAAISLELLASGLEASASEGEPRCVCIFAASGDNPPLDYYQLVEIVENGQDTQTIAFLCEPLSGSRIRHYPWETTLFISGAFNEPKVAAGTQGEISTLVEKDDEKEL